MLLVGAFGVLAIVIASVGIYGVMAYTVAQQTQEIGVRMALGATTGDLRWVVMRRGLTITTLGSALGLLGALLANRLLSALLYEVTPTDVATFAAVTGFLLGVATLAILIPAQATTRIDPVIVLRAEG